MTLQPERAALVSIKLARGALVERPGNELAQVTSREPSLSFKEEGAELAVVAEEGGGVESGRGALVFEVWISGHSRNLYFY